MAGKFDRYKINLPKLFKIGGNPNITAIVQALATSDDNTTTQIANTKEQIFVKTAEGQYLDRLASGFGVQRPPLLGILDSDFRNLIVDLSLKPKQIRQAFIGILDTFWGVLYSRANVESPIPEPYNIHVADTLLIAIDDGPQMQAKVLTGDIATPGAATAAEVCAVLNRIQSLTASVITNEVTNQNFVNIRTNTPGPRGSVNIIGGNIATALGLALIETKITDLPQRTVIYEINPRELVIEIPATVPILRRVLRGSHHFHTDYHMEPIQPDSGLRWQGSFFYNPTGVPYNVTSMSAMTQEPLLKGQVYTKVTVDDASNIPDAPGLLIMNWGETNEEEPIKYIGRPNNVTVLLSPDYTFQKTHLTGAVLNILSQPLGAATPRQDGTDLAIYLTDPTGARELVQSILSELAAAGVVIRFEVLLPKYKYLVANPYA